MYVLKHFFKIIENALEKYNVNFFYLMEGSNMSTITYGEFENVNMRSGTIVRVEEFRRVRKPTFKV